jgi:uncharacterized membrane protein YeaQ/YmgE (transglycosylase-associated protein family)
MKPNKAAYQQCQKCVRTNILMEENITMYIDTLVSIVAALFTGSITGLLVSKIKRSTGFSLLGDILLGTVGALIGLFLAFLMHFGLSMLGNVVAFICACLLLLSRYTISKKEGVS